MRAVSFAEAQPAPLARSGRVLVSAVELDVLHWVSQVDLVHPTATGNIPVNLHDRKGVNQLLSVRLVTDGRLL